MNSNPVLIQTSANNLESSVAFYKRLDFKIISQDGANYVSDGKAIIHINEDRFARPGIKLYAVTWKSQVKDLKELVTVIDVENGYLLSDFSGTWIYLLEEEPPLLDISNGNPSHLGNFAGMSLEVIGMKSSLKLWKLLGFNKTLGDSEQGWVSLGNDHGMTISLLSALNCPHLFFNPSLTYFNGQQNLQIIEKVRAAKIPITEEITFFNKEGVVDNIIIRDPGGLGFFIFND